MAHAIIACRMKVSCTRIIEFDAAHRLMEHKGLCCNIHGHRYQAHITAEAEKLNEEGMVVDFSVIKEKLGGWIAKYWDHTAIIYREDHEACEVLKKLCVNKDLYLLPSHPTAENIALYLLHNICPSLFKNTSFTIRSIRLFETPRSYVDVCL